MKKWRWYIRVLLALILVIIVWFLTLVVMTANSAQAEGIRDKFEQEFFETLSELTPAEKMSDLKQKVRIIEENIGKRANEVCLISVYIDRMPEKPTWCIEKRWLKNAKSRRELAEDAAFAVRFYLRETTE